MVTRTSVLGLLFGLHALAALGCGGDSPLPKPGDVTAAVGSEYWPMPAVGQTLRWTYRVNGGDPVPIETDEGTMTFDYDDVELTREGAREATRARAIVGGQINGQPLTGSLVNKESADLGHVGGVTGITSAESSVEFSFIIAGATIRSSRTLAVKPESPLLYLVADAGLAGLPVGHRVEQRDLGVRVTGRTSISSSELDVNDSENIDQSLEFSTAYTIDDRLESLTVLGRVYEDVIALSRLASSNSPGGPPTQRDTLWVARGVGLIKAERILMGLDTPALWELVTSSLTDR